MKTCMITQSNTT